MHHIEVKHFDKFSVQGVERIGQEKFFYMYSVKNNVMIARYGVNGKR